MSFFAKLEQACAQFVERAFAKSFPSDVEPAQIARKLVATMQAQARDEDGHMIAPGAYTVSVSPSDFERLDEHREYLERAWSDLLRELAAKVGVTFYDGEPRVKMAALASIPLGAISIEIGELPAEETGYCLRMVKGVPPDGVYAIDGPVRVGRGDENEVFLADPGVSRAHAIVDVTDGTPRVRDLESTNGTFVNGRRVKVKALRNGDELRFGSTTMRLESL